MTWLESVPDNTTTENFYRMKIVNFDREVDQLLNTDDWNNIELLAKILKGFDYTPKYTQRLIRKITYLYFDEFLPNLDYHRFGCTLMNKNTFTLIFNRLNEYLDIPYMIVEIVADTITLNAYIYNDEAEQMILLQIELDELARFLFYGLKAKFEIGELRA